MEIVRQGTGLRIEMAVRQLCLQYSRGACSQKHADALRPVSGFGRRDCRFEAILLQAQLGKPVIAAIVSRKDGTDSTGIKLTNLGDISFQIDILERARDQTRTTRA